jgi:YD repeat-containing protein
MRQWIKIIYLISIVILSACDKEDSGFVYTNNSGLLYQVKFDSELYYEYTYNESNQIVEEKSKLHYTKHNYQNGKLLLSDYYIDPGMYSSSSYIVDAAMNRKEWVNPTNTEKNSTKTYSYDNNGKLIKSENYLNICEYDYDERGRINRQTFYRENERTGYIDYFYDNNDNLIKRFHYWILASGEPELQTTTVYEFDNKLNPYKAFNSLMIPGQYTNANNIIKETYTIHFEVDHFIEKLQITENSYKYNTQGFPISKNDSEKYVYY